MSAIEELYQDLIIDHSKDPRNFKKLINNTHKAFGNNPLCGDKLHLELRILHDVIEDAAFTGDGCAISKATASLMTEILKGKTTFEALKLFNDFHSMLVGNAMYDGNVLGKLIVFQGIKQFPMRVKCATLAFHTLQAAINKKEGASTE